MAATLRTVISVCERIEVGQTEPNPGNIDWSRVDLAYVEQNYKPMVSTFSFPFPRKLSFHRLVNSN